MFLRHPCKPTKALLGATFLLLLLGVSTSVFAQGTPNAWGYNFFGALGDGSKTNRKAPVSVANLDHITQLSAGYDFTLALRSDGTVWTWGGGSPNATQVPGIDKIVQVAAGHGHSLALKVDGTVWAWGANGVGQLGDGTTTTRNSPVQVVGLTDVANVAGGGAHSLAVKLDGTVWAWGWNNATQLGTGTNINYSAVPLQVSGLTGAIQVAAGFYQSLAIKADGTGWGWGMNSNGQVGDGTTNGRNVPVQIVGLSGALSIAGGGSHSIAVKNDGTVWAWGYNGSGRLGDGTTSQRNSPVRLTGVTGAIGAAAGDEHSVVLKADGTVWGVGNNQYGQVGDGTNTTCLTAVQVSGLTGQTALSGRHNQSFAVASVPLTLQRQTSLTISPITALYAAPITVKTALTLQGTSFPLGGRAIVLTVDGTTVGRATTATTGDVSITVPALFSIGKHTIAISFAGDDVNAATSASALLTVNKSTTSINAGNVTAVVGSTVTLSAVLSRKSDGAKMEGAELVYMIESTVIGSATTDSSGTAKLIYTIPDTFGAGAKSLTVSYAGDAYYKAGKAVKTLTITKAKTTLTQSSVTGKVGTNVNLSATLKRRDGTALANKTIHFQVNGVAVGDATTDSNGVATFVYFIPTDTVKAKYPLAVSFDEDDVNLGATKTGANLTVK